MSGGSGDADVYVKFGSQPTSSSWDYRPYKSGNAETVNVTNPASGDWYISIHGYSAYSGVSLMADYTAPTCTNPGTTTLSSPASGATGVATSPTLSWNAVSGATSYDVYLSTSSSPAFLRNVTTTSTTAGPLTAGTVYYWKVVAKNSCGSGAASATRSFTTATGPTVTVLTSGQAVTNLSGSSGSWTHYKITVPSGQSSLAIATSGGSGDLDLYVKYGAQPTASVYDYRPYLGGNAESVNVTNPAAGDWYISLHGYSAYSGASLTATYSAAPACTSYSGTLSSGATQYKPGSSGYTSASGTHTGKLTGPASGADFDLYLERWNGSSWSVVASGTSASSTESVSYNGTSGTYRWRVKSYSGSGSYTLCTTKP
jgi:serine protease